MTKTTTETTKTFDNKQEATRAVTEALETNAWSVWFTANRWQNPPEYEVVIKLDNQI